MRLYKLLRDTPTIKAGTMFREVVSDFENGKGGWIVFYSYMYKELCSMRDSYTDSGEPVRYETEEDARRSIEENEQDWKIYFGIKEEE